MKNQHDPVYPHAHEVSADGRILQYSHAGMDLYTHTAILAMQAILSRTDAGIFNPEDVAEKACLHTEALLRRIPD
jgi:hypothetical protein